MATTPSLPPPAKTVIPRRLSDGSTRNFTSMHSALAHDMPEFAHGISTAKDNYVAGTERVIGRCDARVISRTNSLEMLKLEAGHFELAESIEAQGCTPAVVVNLNYWDINCNGVLHPETLYACENGKIKVNGKVYAENVPAKDSYSAIILTEWQQDNRDHGEGIYSQHAWFPMQLAKDYAKECETTKWGGLFFYAGRYLPNDPKMPPDLKEVVAREWAAARKKMEIWSKAVYNLADGTYNKPGGDRNLIGGLDRKAAMWRINNGFVKESNRPKWLDLTTDEASHQLDCPQCRVKVEPATVTCSHCRYVFDPRRAYLNGSISEDNPALKRLTRAELDALELPSVKSIAHLLGAAPVVVAAPAVASDPLTTFEQTGELAELEEELAAEDKEPELSDEELEALTAPPATINEQLSAQKKEKDLRADAKKKESEAKGKTQQPVKSEAQRKAEESLEKS